MSELLDSLAAAFDTLPMRDAAGLDLLRRDALAGARRVGLPGPRAERWKYTSLRALERRTFANAAEPVATETLDQSAAGAIDKAQATPGAAPAAPPAPGAAAKPADRRAHRKAGAGGPGARVAGSTRLAAGRRA